MSEEESSNAKEQAESSSLWNWLFVVFVAMATLKSCHWSYGKIFGDEDRGASPQGQITAKANPVKKELERYALGELTGSNYSLAGPGGLCDRVENAKLSDVQIGKITKTQATGKLATPIPAILARHDYVCVISAMAKKERETEQWVVLAVDKEFGMMRCLRVGPEKMVKDLAKGCGFIPD